MRDVVQRIDRLQRLAVFEAAGRLGGFTAAAHELGLSQPAVTRQIRSLERSLGLELFIRTANRSALSPDGRQLFDSIDSGFTVIESAIADITATKLFVLAVPPGFAQQLLVPHLDTLADLIHDADLRLWLYDRDDELNAGTYDLAIRVGERDWSGFDTIDLFAESVFPVASPALAAHLGLDAASTPSDVLAAPLLHADADGRPWASWDDWLDAFGLTLTPGRRRVLLNNYPAVLQQVIAGKGVALGWRRIVDELLIDGVLVEAGPQLDTHRRYGVSWPSRRSSRMVSDVVDWLQQLVGATEPAVEATPLLQSEP